MSVLSMRDGARAAMIVLLSGHSAEGCIGPAGLDVYCALRDFDAGVKGRERYSRAVICFSWSEDAG